MSDKYNLSFTITKTKDKAGQDCFEGAWQVSCPTLHDVVQEAIKHRLDDGDYSEGLKLDDVLLFDEQGHEPKDQTTHGLS